MKPVCIDCTPEGSTEMNIVRTGVVVVEYTEDEKPYKLWSGDVAACPVCLREVVCRYGNSAFAHNHEKDFEERLQAAEDDTRVQVIHAKFFLAKIPP